MFTWICPRCGREVPPSYTECPDCAAKEKGAPPSNAAEPDRPLANAGMGPEPAAPPPRMAQPQVAAPALQQSAQPQVAVPALQPDVRPQYLPRPRPSGNMPTWLMTLVFALAFVGLGAAIYWSVGYLRSGSHAASPPATVESPAAKPGVKSPLQKYVEISGIRFTQDPKDKNKILVKFILTNHSDADLTGLAGNVTIWGRTQRSEEDAVGTFSFKTNVAPEASEEVSAPLTTKLKMYELPDWQNVTTDLQITAPQ